MMLGCFSAPSFAIFTDLLAGWVCVPGRPTITAMIGVADPAGRRAHDAYHRFVRDGSWQMSGLWRVLAVHAVTHFARLERVSDCAAGQCPAAPQEGRHDHDHPRRADDR